MTLTTFDTNNSFRRQLLFSFTFSVSREKSIIIGDGVFSFCFGGFGGSMRRFLLHDISWSKKHRPR